MAEGKMMKLSELFDRDRVKRAAEYAEKLAYEATPEGAAEKAAREALEQRLMEADRRFAAENPTDQFREGALAAGAGAKREAPDDLGDEDAERWLEGWDSEAPGEDEA